MDTVDLALVLAVDGSASVTYDEFNLIAGGMADGAARPGGDRRSDQRPGQGQLRLPAAVVRHAARRT